VNVYKGLGKAFEQVHLSLRASTHPQTRFLQVPKPMVEKELRTQEKELADDIENLNKKVRQPSPAYNVVLKKVQEKFLQKQYDEAQGRLKDIVGH
jgi:prefoldin subunit 1